MNVLSSSDVEVREPGRPTYKTSLWTPVGSGMSEKDTTSGSSKEWLTRVLADEKEANQSGKQREARGVLRMEMCKRLMWVRSSEIQHHVYVDLLKLLMLPK